MNDGGNAAGEFGLSETLLGDSEMLFEEGREFRRGDESEELEVFFEGGVGLSEPELVEVEDGGFLAVEPDGVAFGFAELTASGFVDNEGARVGVGVGVLEAANEMDAAGAVTELVGAAELEVDFVGAVEVEKVVALDKGVAELGVGDAGTTGTNAFLNELAVEQLGHAEAFADFAEEGQDFDIFKPVEIIEDFGVLFRASDADNLSGESLFVFFEFFKRF